MGTAWGSGALQSSPHPKPRSPLQLFKPACIFLVERWFETKKGIGLFHALTSASTQQEHHPSFTTKKEEGHSVKT